MNMNGGQFGAAVGAQTAMSGLQHTQVGAVNQSYDQLMQLVTGGAGGAATLFGMLGGAPTTVTRGGIRMAARQAITAMGKSRAGLRGEYHHAGRGSVEHVRRPAGMMAALQPQLDWLRNAQTMGTLTAGQTTRMSA